MSRRPTGVVSGPVLFAITDSAGWLVTIAHNWPRQEAVTTDLSMQFLRPVMQGELVVEATTLRIGRRCVSTSASTPRTVLAPNARGDHLRAGSRQGVAVLGCSPQYAVASRTQVRLFLGVMKKVETAGYSTYRGNSYEVEGGLDRLVERELLRVEQEAASSCSWSIGMLMIWSYVTADA